MRILLIQNCTENGEILSCFLRIGVQSLWNWSTKFVVVSITECENRCRTKGLLASEFNDFYNFAQRLNQSNFLYKNAALDGGVSSFQLNSKFSD